MMPPCVPVRPAFDGSAAVSVSVPGVLNVALNVPAPWVRVESAGRLAWPSLLVKWTVPPYPVAWPFTVGYSRRGGLSIARRG